MKKIIYNILYYIYIVIRKGYKETRKNKILAKYNIHKSVNFWENTFITGEGNISIGQDTYISSNPKDASITIGKGCMISHNVQIRTSSYDIKTLSSKNRKIIFNDINIGDNVWIGANVFIRYGVKIGNNVAIGSNSVVLESFPDNVVIAGVPAKIIKGI